MSSKQHFFHHLENPTARRPFAGLLLSCSLALGGAACGSTSDAVDDSGLSDVSGSGGTVAVASGGTADTETGGASVSDTGGAVVTDTEVDTDASYTPLPGSILDTSGMFTNRDMVQAPDTSSATHIALLSGQDVTLTEAGVYVLSGNAEEVTVIVDSPDEEAKIQLVLDGVSVTNSDSPVIYVKSADKVFVTSATDGNSMTVSGTFVPDGETNLDAVIFSRDDLVLNGTGSLEVISAQGNGITSKDDLKITGGVLTITSALDGLEANDSIRIRGGDITIESGKDALHSENDDDDSLGYVFIAGGTLSIIAADDGIRGTSVVQIDAGTIEIAQSVEGIEATYVQINDGDIDVYATDDGINATAKSSAYPVTIEVNGGDIFVEVGSGDTDAFDANGDIVINGGQIEVVYPTQPPASGFDFDDSGVINGGTVIANGVQITQLSGGGGRR